MTSATAPCIASTRQAGLLLCPSTIAYTFMDPNKQTLPWAWIKATNQILSGFPNKDPDYLPVELLPWLFLSDEFNCIWQPDKLKELGITHVLTVNERTNDEIEKTREKLQSIGITYHAVVGARDIEGYDMIDNHWEECLQFFQQAKTRPTGKIAVSCVAGVNRSGLMAAAAMLVLGDDEVTGTLLDVVRLLKRKRGQVLTNFSFQKQLCLLAAREGKLGEFPEGFSDEPLPDDFEPKRQKGATVDW